jgi:hypothetical protein
MTQATSKIESALEDVRTTLEDISGSSYNYPVETAVRVDGPFFQYLDDNYKTMAFVEEGLISWVHETHGGNLMATLEVFVQIATKYEPDSDNPSLMTTPSKSTIRMDLLQDGIKALMADKNRGGFSNGRFFITDSAPINLDEISQSGVWQTSGWAAYEMRFEMSVDVSEAAP